MRQDDGTVRTERRRFLGMATAGAAGAAAAVVGLPEAKADVPAAPKAQGYHETPHVKTYYASARF